VLLRHPTMQDWVRRIAQADGTKGAS